MKNIVLVDKVHTVTEIYYTIKNKLCRDINLWRWNIGRFSLGHSPPLPPKTLWKFGLPKRQFLHFKSSFECNLKVSVIIFIGSGSGDENGHHGLFWDFAKATGRGQSIMIASTRKTHFGRMLRSVSFNNILTHLPYLSLKSNFFFTKIIVPWLSNCTKNQERLSIKFWGLETLYMEICNLVKKLQGNCSSILKPAQKKLQVSVVMGIKPTTPLITIQLQRFTWRVKKK